MLVERLEGVFPKTFERNYILDFISTGKMKRVQWTIRDTDGVQK